MKQFKLIKEYPGSPELDDIINYNNKTNSARTLDGHNYYNGINPENYPEFWEEIVEKDYEILEVKGKYGAISSYIKELDYDLKDKIIFKIKRLSDSEIFTIGDKVNNGIIKSIFIPFEFGTTTVCIQCDNKKGIYLKDIQKIKQPLFTTEDCVDIFEGDECYYVKFINYNNTLGRPFEFIKINWNSFTYEPQYEKYFSTKEKAEEYI